MSIRAYVEGEPELIERSDGWYVEIYAGGGIHSFGPTKKGVAEKIYQAAVDARRAANHG